MSSDRRAPPLAEAFHVVVMFLLLSFLTSSSLLMSTIPAKLNALSPAVKTMFTRCMGAASRFQDPNFKQYFQRITNSDFDRFAALDEATRASQEPDFLKEQEKNFAILDRQSYISDLYYSDHFHTTKK